MVETSYAETPVLPPHLTHLLQKLQSFDTRVYYVRFGHEAVVSCTNCFSFSDYYAYYGSRIAAEYARTCLLAGFMTIKGSGKRRWRKWAVAAIFSAFFLEVVQIGTVEVYMGGGASTCTMVSPVSPPTTPKLTVYHSGPIKSGGTGTFSS